MQKRITFSGRPHSPVLDEQIDKQLEKIVRFLEGEGVQTEGSRDTAKTIGAAALCGSYYTAFNG